MTQEQPMDEPGEHCDRPPIVIPVSAPWMGKHVTLTLDGINVILRDSVNGAETNLISLDFVRRTGRVLRFEIDFDWPWGEGNGWDGGYEVECRDTDTAKMLEARLSGLAEIVDLPNQRHEVWKAREASRWTLLPPWFR
jgi:hypothetical protein